MRGDLNEVCHSCNTPAYPSHVEHLKLEDCSEKVGCDVGSGLRRALCSIGLSQASRAPVVVNTNLSSGRRYLDPVNRRPRRQ